MTTALKKIPRNNWIKSKLGDTQ